MQSFDMGATPPILFGPGTLEQTPAVIAGLGGGPVLVVADRILAELGVTEALEHGLSAAGIGCEMAPEVAGEPKEALVDQLADRARKTGCRVVIGIGGGAAMDCAKLVAGIAGADAPASHYALSAHSIPAQRLPALAIPTTAGTGSEVTRTAIVSTGSGEKLWYWDERLLFAYAILDPDLTLTLPPAITAWTGIDAVAHALEAVTARRTSEAGLLYGHRALAMLAEALPRAVADGSDREARGRMLWASTVAGLALHNCNTHLGHNISHALGSLARVHHGLATGLALEVALPWLVTRPEGAELYAAASAAMGGPATSDALPATFAGLMRQAGIPAALPTDAADVRAETLAEAMRSPANHGMSQNALTEVTDADLSDLARAVLDLPKQEIAA